MEAARPSETLVSYLRTKRRQNREDLEMNLHVRDNLKSVMSAKFISYDPTSKLQFLLK
jgi:hypothetical protein